MSIYKIYLYYGYFTCLVAFLAWAPKCFACCSFPVWLYKPSDTICTVRLFLNFLVFSASIYILAKTVWFMTNWFWTKFILFYLKNVNFENFQFWSIPLILEIECKTFSRSLSTLILSKGKKLIFVPTQLVESSIWYVQMRRNCRLRTVIEVWNISLNIYYFIVVACFRGNGENLKIGIP